jgi:hypothetical protein
MTTMLEPEVKAAQATVSTEFRMTWRNQIMEDSGLPLMEADRIISDTLSFLTACALNPCNRYRPSKKVDIGWHQFILNTRDYAEFWEGTAVVDTLRPTVDAIEAAGLPIHKELWFAEAGKCTQCHAGCTSCGQEDQP